MREKKLTIEEVVDVLMKQKLSRIDHLNMMYLIGFLHSDCGLNKQKELLIQRYTHLINKEGGNKNVSTHV